MWCFRDKQFDKRAHQDLRGMRYHVIKLFHLAITVNDHKNPSGTSRGVRANTANVVYPSISRNPDAYPRLLDVSFAFTHQNPRVRLIGVNFTDEIAAQAKNKTDF
jgi:hypothetical protein